MEKINYDKSIFFFCIEGTLEEFEHKLRTFHKKGVVNFVEDFAVTYYCKEKDYKIKFEKEYTLQGDVWRISSESKKKAKTSKYIVKKKEDSRVCVVFEGPLLGLWQQYLLPHINYINGTLVGKYDGMENFLPIKKFMKIRLDKNKGESNEQDKISGHKVNKIFLNEIETLPIYKGKAGDKWQDEKPYKVVSQRQRNDRKENSGKEWRYGHRRRS